MPVVPFSTKQPSASKPRQPSAAEEPWALMAAAVMDAEGRLVEEDGALKVGASEGASSNAT
jgi:hypothetical protein